MIKDLPNIGTKKSTKVREKIHQILDILSLIGLPLEDLTPRRQEKMAMAVLALCGQTESTSWSESKSISDGHILRTREIISYINDHFEEKISSGSYDDIRRKDLKRPEGMGLVIKSANNPNADTNDGTRGYALNDNFLKLVKSYKSDKWAETLKNFETDQDYINQLVGKREVKKISVKITPELELSLDAGPHNELQKAVVEDFLTFFGYGATVLYIADTTDKQMHKYGDKMIELGLDVADRGMLPDIIAFSESKKWVYLIEAVHSSNPFNAERCIELKRTVLKDCPYGIIFVTAFLNKTAFSKYFKQIAWETEVWLADNPKHMVHFNGDRFIGPHDNAPSI